MKGYSCQSLPNSITSSSSSSSCHHPLGPVQNLYYILFSLVIDNPYYYFFSVHLIISYISSPMINTETNFGTILHTIKFHVNKSSRHYFQGRTMKDEVAKGDHFL